jgi:hypothetical protein
MNSLTDVSVKKPGAGSREPLLRRVLCERRVIPHGQRVRLMVPPIRREGGEWVCDMRSPYAQGVVA